MVKLCCVRYRRKFTFNNVEGEPVRDGRVNALKVNV